MATDYIFRNFIFEIYQYLNRRDIVFTLDFETHDKFIK
ncbi:unnamed protein product [Brassica rapa]|uniref:Uncharacterized protein n=1 Tax=Brassica campestris TaxID=3711 RepID=A0A8D9G2Y4_BRACM|nr:unnamed protein product [Brassica rapa]